MNEYSDLGFYWELLEKTKQERDELLSLALDILQLYEDESNRRKGVEKALVKERENSKRERDESFFVVQLNQELYEEETRHRREAQEALEKEREETEKMKKEIEDLHMENQKLLEIHKKELEEMMVERDMALGLSEELSKTLAEEDSSPPPYFICPISHEIMRDPHVAADGFTYESEEFRKWINSGGLTSPMTNLRLRNHYLVPNRALRSMIQDWLARHPNFHGSS